MTLTPPRSPTTQEPTEGMTPTPSSSSPTIIPTPRPHSPATSTKMPAGKDIEPSTPAGADTAGPSRLPEGCEFGPLIRIDGKRIHSIPPTAQRSASAEAAQGAGTDYPRAKDRSGATAGEDLEGETVRAIWVDFPPSSPDNPYFFSPRRKLTILITTFYFAFITSFATSSYTMGFGSMQRDLDMTDLQAYTGTTLFGWGFAIGPLVLAPLTEELGRFWFFMGSVISFTLLHLTGSLAQNVGTVLVGRFLLGLSGCIGAVIIAGVVADLYPADQRGRPMAIFTLSVTIAPGMGPIVMCWVENVPSLEWRWIYWIEMFAVAVYAPIVYFVLTETRADVLLQRRAKALRKSRGLSDGGRYTARTEVDRKPFKRRMAQSLTRPILFLFLEPVVTFFAIWAALVWGVYFVEIAGLPYVFRTVHGFNITQSGMAYIAVALGTFLGFCLNFLQDYIYVRRVAKDGVEARLYAPMAAGFFFAIGCIIFGLTSTPDIIWVAPCIGIVILMIGAYTIYNCCFTYLAECYGSHASSAVAGMSFLRIFLGSSFPMFTVNMFESLTPRWSLFMFGCIALPLAGVPIVAFYKGRYIRDRSPLSKKLMAEEQKRLAVERGLSRTEVTPGVAQEKTQNAV